MSEGPAHGGGKDVVSTGGIDADGIARQVANAVGDGCVVRLHDAERDVLRAVAVDHRDERTRQRLGRLLDAPGWPVAAGWSADVMRSGRPLRLASIRARDRAVLEAGGHALREELGVVLVVALRDDGAIVGTVSVLRSHGAVPYSLREQTLVEGLVGRAVRRSAREGVPAEPELSEPELTASLLTRSDAAVWATDLDGRTLAVTAAMSELISLPSASVVGLPMGDFVDPPPTALSGIVPDEPERADRRLRRADGTWLWIATSSTPLVDAGGRRRGTLTTATDVTCRKETEIGLRLRLDATRGLVRMIGGVLRGHDPGELLDGAVAAAADLLGAWRVGVFELRRDGALLLRAGRGWPAGAIGRERATTLGAPAGLALTCDEPVVVRDLATWRGASVESVAHGAGGGCWVGIGGGRGVLAVLEREPCSFDADELDLLVALTEALAACVGAPANAGDPAIRVTAETAR